MPQKLVPVVLTLTGRNKIFRSKEAAQRHAAGRMVRPLPFAPPQRLRDDVSITREDIEGWPVYSIVPRRSAPRGRTVFVHGGGWVNEIAARHWQLAARIAAEAGTTVTVPIYPLVPRGTAEHVVRGVASLVQDSMDRDVGTRLFGDSAGGQIALSATMRLRDAGTTLARTVLLSPAADLTWSNPRIDDVQPRDPWLRRPGGEYFGELWRADLPATDPSVSPLYGDFEGMGPISIFTGTRDILNPDAHLLHDAARSAGVDVDFHEADGEVHVYALLPTARGKQDAQRIVDALRVR
ncbi:acetyl esterase/lipase [Haloactinospora alba]|uniref:Acetyl esterase/lipase n=1 Tax=Haloactinospora alba TaxID=405555 RepID=A0A543NLZ8_9ACTN|nr:alpha/beta hydrolase fold domain-containing protein [Haloactinospora alba]TQN32853.1 acetyl esterase/lipase [Haloactinospora alba]